MEHTLTESKLDPYKGKVDQMLEEARYSALRILEKLREMWFDEMATVRFETMPGKQGPMDRRSSEDHLVYEDGKWKKLYCFLMILGYSKMQYIEFVMDMSTNTLIRCHQDAF